MGPKLQQWDAPAIKAEIERRGATLSALCLKAGVARNSASLALRAPYSTGEHIISSFLGIPASELWPERYNPLAKVRPTTRNSKKASAKIPVPHSDGVAA